MDRQSTLVAHRFGRRALLAGTLACATLGIAHRAVAQDSTPTPTSSAPREAEASPVGSPVASPVATSPVFESTIESLKYLPPEIDIEAGTTVIWINKDVVAHTVTHKVAPKNQLFASPYLKTGERFSYTFETPGTYLVFCIPHPFMGQTVVVSEKS